MSGEFSEQGRRAVMSITSLLSVVRSLALHVSDDAYLAGCKHEMKFFDEIRAEAAKLAEKVSNGL